MEINLNNVIIEVTRKCNFMCSHCLRGDQENRVMNLKYVENLFENTKYISSLTFSGGEPFLYTNIINQILKLAKKYKVDIGNFYIATNGTIQNDEVLLTVLKLYQYCSDNELSTVKISMDHHHSEQWGSYETGEEIKSFWKAFSFVEYDEEKYYRKYIQEGYAKYNEGRPAYISDELEIDMYNEENVCIDNEIYLNCKGKIILGCDLSYESQEKHVFCDIEQLPQEIIKAQEKEQILQQAS